MPSLSLPTGFTPCSLIVQRVAAQVVENLGLLRQTNQQVDDPKYDEFAQNVTPGPLADRWAEDRINNVLPHGERYVFKVRGVVGRQVERHWGRHDRCHQTTEHSIEGNEPRVLKPTQRAQLP